MVANVSLSRNFGPGFRCLSQMMYWCDNWVGCFCIIFPHGLSQGSQWWRPPRRSPRCWGSARWSPRQPSSAGCVGQRPRTSAAWRTWRQAMFDKLRLESKHTLFSKWWLYVFVATPPSPATGVGPTTSPLFIPRFSCVVFVVQWPDLLIRLSVYVNRQKIVMQTGVKIYANWCEPKAYYCECHLKKICESVWTGRKYYVNWCEPAREIMWTDANHGSH